MIEIKKVSYNEVEQLQLICRKTFGETFTDRNSVENMSKYLTEELSIGKLKTELSNPESEFYFAYLNNSIVGYCKINFGQAQTDLKENKAMEIERVYVSKEFHGQKIGKALIDYSQKIAVEKKVDYIWLGVWEENIKAINFYNQNGYKVFSRHIFMLGDDEQKDLLMKLVLK